MQKKGQLTIFITIGILILLSYFMMAYLSGEFSTSRKDTNTAVEANFDADITTFQVYTRSVFEDAVYSSLIMWGASGGVNTRSSPLPYPVQTFGDATNERTIAILLDEDGPVGNFKEKAIQEDLRTILQSTFNAKWDRGVFKQRGYELAMDSLPVANITANQEGTTTFTLVPNFKMVRGPRERSFAPISIQLDIGIYDMVNEIDSFLSALDSDKSTEGHDLSTYRPGNSHLRICSYNDNGVLAAGTGPCESTGEAKCSLIRFMYDAPLKRYSTYRFDFLAQKQVDDPEGDGSCTA